MKPVMDLAHWVPIEAALVRSIHTGIFFDKKYWARHSKAGDVLKPVYFSGTAMNDKIQQLNKCTWSFHCCMVWPCSVPPVVKCLRDRNPFAGDPEGDVNVESDCERDLSEVTNGLPEVEGDGEALRRAVLTFGSFSAYVYSHFFIPSA